MQETLSVYGAQGWKLVSVTPDTWRTVSGKLGSPDSLNLNPSPSDSSEREFSASYYLLVFERQGDLVHGVAQESASETLEYPDFSLPDF